MKNALIVMEFNELLKIIDKLNSSGKGLFIKESDIISKMISIMNNYHFYSIHDKVDILLTELGLDDILDNDPSFTEMLKSNLYIAFNDLYVTMTDLLLTSHVFKIRYINRHGKNGIFLKVYNND